MSTRVEASEGTGKTTAVVDRIVAVTFPHAAAGNVKVRGRRGELRSPR